MPRRSKAAGPNQSPSADIDSTGSPFGVLLRLYEAHWGEVQHVKRVHHGDEFFFVGVFTSQDDVVARIATVGACHLAPSAAAEYLFTLPTDLGGVAIDDAVGFMVDVVANIRSLQLSAAVGSTIGTARMSPWKPHGLLFDHPLGEPEELEELPWIAGTVPLRWLIPVFSDEVEAIRSGGMEAWQELCDSAELSPVDVRRQSFVRLGDEGWGRFRAREAALASAGISHARAMTTRFSSLLFGTSEPKASTHALLQGLRPDLSWREGDSDYRGGVYYESPADPGADPYHEHWYVQDNADMGDIAEEDGPEVPTLVYIEATTAPDDRERELGSLGVLTLLRREDWDDPRTNQA